MTELEMENARQREMGLSTLRTLRSNNFQRGISFQMLDERLPKGQAYYQFADGHIEIRELVTGQGKPFTKHIRNLNEQEGAQILLDHELQ